MNQEKFFNKENKTNRSNRDNRSNRENYNNRDNRVSENKDRNKNKNFNRDGRNSQWQDNQKKYNGSGRFDKADNRTDGRPNDKFNKTNKTDRIDKTFNKEGKREFKPKKNFNDYIPGKDDDRIEDLGHRSKKRDSGNKKKNDFSELEGMLSAKDKNRSCYENNKRKGKKKKNDYDDWDDGWN